MDKISSVFMKRIYFIEIILKIAKVVLLPSTWPNRQGTFSNEQYTYRVLVSN